MIKYIMTSQSGKGFITHDDQEKDGLSFSVKVSIDGVSYVMVSGEEVKINAWKVRVEGTETTQAAVQVIIDSLPLSDIEQIGLRVENVIKVLEEKSILTKTEVDAKEIIIKATK